MEVSEKLKFPSVDELRKHVDNHPSFSRVINTVKITDPAIEDQLSVVRQRFASAAYEEIQKIMNTTTGITTKFLKIYLVEKEKQDGSSLVPLFDSVGGMKTGNFQRGIIQDLTEGYFVVFPQLRPGVRPRNITIALLFWDVKRYIEWCRDPRSIAKGIVKCEIFYNGKPSEALKEILDNPVVISEVPRVQKPKEETKNNSVAERTSEDEDMDYEDEDGFKKQRPVRKSKNRKHSGSHEVTA